MIQGGLKKVQGGLKKVQGGLWHPTSRAYDSGATRLLQPHVLVYRLLRQVHIPMPCCGLPLLNGLA